MRNPSKKQQLLIELLAMSCGTLMLRLEGLLGSVQVARPSSTRLQLGAEFGARSCLDRFLGCGVDGWMDGLFLEGSSRLIGAPSQFKAANQIKGGQGMEC